MSLPDTTAPPGWAHYTEPQFVDVDGLRTAYRREGAGDALVYLHGGGLTRIWLPFLQRLSADFDVIAPEHPGFGDTALPDDLDRFDDLVLHYDGLLHALGLDRIHLVGHSLGGWIAADLAVFYPRRFASLTLITPAGLRLADAPLIDTFRMTPEESRSALFNGREDRHEELFVHEGGIADLIQISRERATLTRLTWNPRYDRKLDARLARVTAPTLVVGAQDDRVVPTAMAARFAEMIPGARLVTAPGDPSGHVPHVEDPEGVAAIVAEHLEACS